MYLFKKSPLKILNHVGSRLVTCVMGYTSQNKEWGGEKGTQGFQET